MMLPAWDDLPDSLRLPEVHEYYDILRKKRGQLFIKRLFDVLASLILIVLTSPILLYVSLKIRNEDDGPVFFRQRRVTALAKEFDIYKFRTMVPDAQSRGPQLTSQGDDRITPIGKKLRERRLDEIPQLFNILRGEMTFVGTRPEVPRFVQAYTPQMMATLLLPAGLTSSASVAFKDEDAVYAVYPHMDQDTAYVNHVLPIKMKYNLEALSTFSLITDCRILLNTVKSVLLRAR